MTSTSANFIRRAGQAISRSRAVGPPPAAARTRARPRGGGRSAALRGRSSRRTFSRDGFCHSCRSPSGRGPAAWVLRALIDGVGITQGALSMRDGGHGVSLREVVEALGASNYQLVLHWLQHQPNRQDASGNVRPPLRREVQQIPVGPYRVDMIRREFGARKWKISLSRRVKACMTGHCMFSETPWHL